MNAFRKSLFIIFILLSAFSSQAQIDVQRVMTIGRNALYFNDFVVSIGYFNQVIGSRPWMAEPYFYRAVAKVNLDDYNGAESDATQCINRNAFIPKAYLVRGVARQNRKQFAEAVKDYRKGLRLTPNDEGMRYNLARCELMQEHFDQAQQELERMLIYEPGSKDAYLLLSAVAIRQKDTLRAERYLDTIVKQDSFYGPAYAVRSQIAYEQGDFGRSLKLIDRAIELIQNDASLYVNRGIIRYQVNDLRGSMSDYSHVLELQPDNKVALFNRALLRSYIGDKNNAIRDLDNLLRLDPKNKIARFNRGLLLADVGRQKEAITDYDEVLKSYPKFINGWLARSQSRRALGNAVGADRDYWHAMDLREAERKHGYKKDKQQNKEPKETRKEDDEEIDKFNLLVKAESETEAKAQYSSKVRGRVQDRNVEVEPRPLFMPTYYHLFSEDEVNQSSTYSAIAEAVNKEGILPYRLILSNREMPLDQSMMDRHQKDLQEVSGDQLNAADYLRRGLNYLLLQNHEQAIADFTASLDLNPGQPMLLFARAVSVSKQQEAENNRTSAVISGTMSRQDQLIAGEQKNTLGFNEKELMAREERFKKPLTGLYNPINDLTAAIKIAPNFAYAFYNRACLYAAGGDKDKALADYTEAIRLRPQMSDAYYNRGLLYLSMGKMVDGIKDLSKAGELGIYQAYNLLKRMNK